MRTTIRLLTVLSLLIVMGCSAQRGSATEKNEPVTTVPTTSGSPLASEQSAARIPDGTWSRVATRQEAQERKLDMKIVGPMLGGDGKLPIDLKIEGDRWTVFVTDDSGITEVGDVGSATYDEEGHWVTTSESVGCPQCTARVQWQLAGDKLVLAFAPADRGATHDDERLVVEGEYRRSQ